MYSTVHPLFRVTTNYSPKKQESDIRIVKKVSDSHNKPVTPISTITSKVKIAEN